MFLFILFLMELTFLLPYIFTATGIMLYLEIQRGKLQMPKWSDQGRELGATTSCSSRGTTKMANCGKKN
jgi:hypothetical protein